MTALRQDLAPALAASGIVGTVAEEVAEELAKLAWPVVCRLAWKLFEANRDRVIRNFRVTIFGRTLFERAVRWADFEGAWEEAFGPRPELAT